MFFAEWKHERLFVVDSQSRFSFFVNSANNWKSTHFFICQKWKIAAVISGKLISIMRKREKGQMLSSILYAIKNSTEKVVEH